MADPRSEHQVVIAGESVSLRIRVLGYERSSLQTGSDANLLMADVELTASFTGDFRVRQGVSLRTEELAGFRDQLAAIVAQLDGDATLSHLEGEVGCTIKLRRGKGQLSAYVRTHVPHVELVVEDATTDQSHLQAAVRSLDSIVRAFPVRGDPFG